MSAADRAGHRASLLLPATTLLLAGLAAGCSSRQQAGLLQGR